MLHALRECHATKDICTTSNQVRVLQLHGEEVQECCRFSVQFQRKDGVSFLSLPIFFGETGTT